ncbi:hypothetical protein G3I59_36780 [Amycolatopsis rubida]|uniref:Uncharacterized protein n=1 Tax=Amycolatopsis rubida TaxID=112413 RepID=A0ABX0C003_9PSEU|nr:MULTISPECIES: hypothetical protein [Amycolatopsis]MYW96015.1 hypothetical protein [Amycolatopsis rubida]NEC61006.1 hypothetical protein [Amycolatopsis rubida]OAP20555.1 hypothetical protein A4R44_08715 [Amycolatopsis sp. M39]
MRILLLRSLGGHPARTVIDHDHAAAEWLLSTGLAVAAPDAQAEPTGPARVEPETTTHDDAVTSPTTRSNRQSSRTATPGG